MWHPWPLEAMNTVGGWLCSALSPRVPQDAAPVTLAVGAHLQRREVPERAAVLASRTSVTGLTGVA